MERLLLTRKEAAASLGISVDTLDVIRNSGKLKYVYIGSRVYFSPDVLRAFVAKEGRINA